MAYFVSTVRLLNAYHIKPVIVIMPYQPRVLSAFMSVGWGVKEHWLDDYLQRLSGHLKFTVLNCLHISTFGGSADGFYDGAHLDIPNSRRLVRYVIKHAPGSFVLPKPPKPTPSPTPSASPSPSPSSSAGPLQPVTAPSYSPVPEITDVPAKYFD